MDNNNKKTTGLYKIAASIIKKVKSGSSYKTQLYQAQYPVSLKYFKFYNRLVNYISWALISPT